MMSIWPAIAAGISPDQVPMVKSIGTPMQAKAARAKSASRPISFEKSFGSRWLNGTLSPSWPILMVLPARAGYFDAILSGSQPASAAREGADRTTARIAKQIPTRTPSQPDL